MSGSRTLNLRYTSFSPMSSVSFISDNLLAAAAHLVSRIAILFLAAVPPKLMARDKKRFVVAGERAMDERRGEETKAVKTELQKKSTKWGRNGRTEVYVFCLEAEGFSPHSEEEDETAPSKKVLLLQFWPSMTDGGGDNMCQSSLFDLENESAGRSRCIWRVQKEATQRQTGRERADRARTICRTRT